MMIRKPFFRTPIRKRSAEIWELMGDRCLTCTSSCLNKRLALLDKSGTSTIHFTHCSNTPKSTRAISIFSISIDLQEAISNLGTLLSRGKHNKQSFCHFCTLRRGSCESTYAASVVPEIRNVSFPAANVRVSASAQVTSDATFKRSVPREMEDGKGRDLLWDINRKGHCSADL